MRASFNKKRGLVLIAVLWIVVVMTAIAAIVGQTSRLDMKMAAAAMDETRCKWACRAGTETAFAVLNDDPKDADCLSDLWSDNDEDFNDVRLERCRHSVRVIDEASKLNINTATKDQLMSLRRMEAHIADAILDWRDRDDNPGPEGAEAGYYENLPFPYTIRNGGFKTVRELLAVKGVTAELLYGEDTNLNGQLDYNEMDGDVSPPADNGDSYLDRGWIAYLTCYSYDNNVDAAGQNRTNINQANEQQLESALGINAAQARWIVQNRGRGFRSIADLIDENSARQPPDSSGGSSADGNETQPIDVQTFKAISDKITIANERQIPGRININTAPEEVLVALLGGGDENRGPAQAIIAERAGLIYGFATIGSLIDIQAVGIERFKRIADLITIRSDVYTIRCFARASVSGATYQTECVVDRSASPGAVLYWFQGANY